MFLKGLEHLAFLKMRKVSKLSPKYCGLFTLLKRVGDRAYKLDLPKHSKVHPSHLCTRIGSDDNVVDRGVLVDYIELPTLPHEAKHVLDVQEKCTESRNYV